MAQKLAKSTRKGPISATEEPQVNPDESNSKNFLDYLGARAAFNQLVNDNADEHILGSLLQIRVIFGNVKTQEHRWSPPRRVIKSVSSKAIALANQVSDLNRYPRILDVRIEKEPAARKFDWSRESLSYLELLPQMLREYAQALDGASARPRPRQKAGARDSSALRLLCYIRGATGRYHYEAVATLLNAVDYAISTRDELRWYAPVLRQLIYRSRERLRASDTSWICPRT
jgi:hypothetical protein